MKWGGAKKRSPHYLLTTEIDSSPLFLNSLLSLIRAFLPPHFKSKAPTVPNKNFHKHTYCTIIK